MQRSTRTMALAGVTALAIAAVTASAGAADKPYEGVTVNIVTFTGPQIAEPLQRRAPDFEKLTGAKVQVITVPFSDLYNKLLTDFATGTNSYDAAVFAPQWMGDFIEPGYLEDADRPGQGRHGAEVGRHRALLPRLQRQLQGQGLHHPARWRLPDGLLPDRSAEGGRPGAAQDLGRLSRRSPRHFNGKDLNGDGKADYGSCIAKKRNAQSLLVHHLDRRQLPADRRAPPRAPSSTPQTMTPLINNEGFRKALQIYIELTKYGPPDEINLDVGDTRGLFTSGRCALTLDWGDIGTLAIDPKTSKVQDKVGAVIIPGTKQVRRPRHRQARPLRRQDLPLCHRRRQPRPVRGLRRLVGRDQRGQGRRRPRTRPTPSSPT